MSPLISVILPIYNMEKYLVRCLDSILGNTYQNLEILCVDDGSKDHSLEILQQYAEKNSRIVVIAKENGGVSSARNAGLDRMTGDFVCFIDPDDFVHPQFLSLLLQTLEKTDASVSCCSFRIVEDKDLPVEYDEVQSDCSEVQLLSTEQVFKNHTIRSFCWNKLFRKEMLHSVRFREDMK